MSQVDDLALIGAALLLFSTNLGKSVAGALGKATGDAAVGLAGSGVELVKDAFQAPYDAGQAVHIEWAKQNTQAIADITAPGGTQNAVDLFGQQFVGNFLAGNYGDLLGGVNSPQFLALERAAGVNDAMQTNPAWLANLPAKDAHSGQHFDFYTHAWLPGSL